MKNLDGGFDKWFYQRMSINGFPIQILLPQFKEKQIQK